MIRKLIYALAASALAFGSAACNTVEGLGQDVESVGEAGDRAL